MKNKPTVLIVDDESMNINILMDLLKSDYRLIAAKDGTQALQRVSQSTPDLILLDIMMPGMDGYSVCERLKASPDTRDIPVIFISAMGEVQDETRGFEVGAVDYITKPFSPPVVLARVSTHIQLCQAQKAMKAHNQQLEEQVQLRTRELAITQDVTIHSLASLAETRDNETGNHIRRTQYYVKALAEYLQLQGPYAKELPQGVVEPLFKSAPLHDIGKVGIPDAILLKPGKLDHNEFDVMKTHTTLGRDAIAKAEAELQDVGDEDVSKTSFLRLAREIAYSHHEKWDGSGYPEGLSGVDIPLSARLMAVADVYDALISRRVYKEPMTHEQARTIILDGRGSHFDPVIVDAFIVLEPEFQAIAARYQD
ncbi:response regulator [Alteromonas lipolytica]|uniref:Two-component system response regulator n=1 Tax=Alteromonas lipolytica TaxID=1856405 RepID=A0A1E8FAL1_9ALTE|nr:two-component system response regulator [Alteromonas lipolytica]OFI32951.1 two-component system response regulator [Alteromonas lipolytica]GGF63955.1 two-component system response regulator [Alteromonas lipolytica]